MSVDRNEGEPKGFNQLHAKRFDHLMNRYLSEVASVSEKKELGNLVQNGFKEDFLKWLDEYYGSDIGVEIMTEKARKEILINILNTTPTKTKNRRLWWSWAAAAVLFTLASVFWLSQQDNFNVKQNLTELVPENINNEWLVYKGKNFLRLPDGSRVLMNNDSELSYSPASFKSGMREVKLSGEAYFDISHDPKSAFKVWTGTVVTRVLGTAFNVNAKQKEIVVTVTKGLVEVSEKGHVYAQLKPDERITVNTETQQYNTASVLAIEEIDWKNTTMIFDNIDLQEAGKLIGEHYGVKLIFAQTELTKCRITASFLNDEDLDTVLNVLSEMMGATYTKDGNKILIIGGSCG